MSSMQSKNRAMNSRVSALLKRSSAASAQCQKTRQWLPVAALCLGFSGATLAQQNTEGPELRLFTSTIVEDVRRTSEAASSMENGMIEVIETMDRQMAAFKASQCEGAGTEDTGCATMRQQLMSSYGEMLDQMSSALPEMDEAISRSRDGLKEALATQLGRNMNSTQLQELLLEEGKANVPIRARATGGRSRLSQRFEQYANLAAQSVGGAPRGRGALVVTAADMYLDMAEASELIKFTQDQIESTRLFIKLDQVMPGMTEQMELTVDGAKSILFGEPSDAQPASLELPPGADVTPGGEEVYVSPLEL